jgi:hypothetical protein
MLGFYFQSFDIKNWENNNKQNFIQKFPNFYGKKKNNNKKMFLEKKKIESQIIWLLVVLYSVEGN